MLVLMSDRIDRLVTQWLTERPELDCSGLDVVARVQDVAKKLRRVEDETLEALNLKMSEYDVLTALRRQGRPFQLTASELARESLLSSGAMTNRIDRLEERGLVEREADPDDRRGVIVRLTEEGRELVDKALEARLHLADAQIATLTPEERHVISVGLRKVMAATS
jgi:DNA-binding MarR family transcriptional regulator